MTLTGVVLSVLALCIALAVVQSSSLIHRTQTTVQAQPNLPPSEMAALQDFYDSCNGPNWVTRRGNPWVFTAGASPCTEHWQGVTCRLVAPHYHVHSLDMLRSNLAGTLPVSLVNLTQIIYFGASANRLNGTVPEFLGNMTSLLLIDLSTNDFVGSLPASLGNLHLLESIDISVNSLTGHIPESFADLNNLVALSFGDNELSGPIPCVLGQLTKLQAMHFYFNRFTGQIPDCVCNFTEATIFDLAGNLLSGTIPATIANMTLLNTFYLYGNKLTGSFPESIGALSTLNNLEIYDNFLSGSLPNTIGGMQSMSIFAVYDNRFTGTLPNSMQNMTRLDYLYANSNHFTGTVPSCIGNMSDLILLDIHANHLEGTIPPFAGNFSRLQYMVLHDNMLTGTIPASVANQTLMREFQVQDNQLSGSLQDLFRAEVHTLLTTIQVNNNQLTGELPAEIFELPLLNTFAAVSNCFEGQLPHTVCNATKMDSLILDGLSSAKACRAALLPGISQSYTTQYTIHGTVPQCLFTHATLTTLHLSGNGFTGTLPGNITLGTSLIDLTLSHNLLTGHIPPNFQVREWFTLDLSYNKLGGTLQPGLDISLVNSTAIEVYERSLGINTSTVTVAPTLLLENNRLSGHIPAAVREELNISILGTNVFSCQLDRSDLPTHDSGKVNYQCGSDSFDVPYYVWLALLLVVVCAAIVWWVRARLYGTERTVLHSIVKLVNFGTQTPNIVTVQRVLSLFQDISVGATVYILLFLLPMCCLLTHCYGTLTHQYAWGVSAAYLSGEVPAAWEFALFITLLCVALGAFLYLTPTASGTAVKADAEARSSVARASESPIALQPVAVTRSIAIYAIFITINLAVVVGVNSAFVYVAIYQSYTMLLVAQLLISLFKIAWNNVCSAIILREIVKLVVRDEADGVTHAQFASLQVFVALLNNIVVPCFVVAVISPDCFYNVFDAAPAVSSAFSYPSCVLDDNFVCISYTASHVTTSYDPPFRYSYQCSSSFITYYAPAFVILCLVVTFVNPTLQLLMLYCHRHARADSVWFKILDTVLPRILKPLNADPTTAEMGQTGVYFDANRVLIIALTFLGLLLTFGAVFPPLAVAICLTVLSVVYWAKYKLGRFLSTAQEQQLHQYVEVIERECAQVGSSAVLHNSMWMLITISCWFYTLFLFDTLGDAVGFDDALWVLVVMPVMPLVLYSTYSLHARFVPTLCGEHCGSATEIEKRESELVGIGEIDRNTGSVDMGYVTTLNILQQP